MTQRSSLPPRPSRRPTIAIVEKHDAGGGFPTIPATPDAKITASRSPATVLVVDVDEDCCESVALALSRAGVVVIQALDIPTAREMLGGFGVEARFDAVVIDVDMAPSLDTHGIPVVMMGCEVRSDVALLKPARSVEILGAIAGAGGFGQRSCVLVEDTNGDVQRRWVKRLARHGAVVASSKSGAAFIQAATLFRPKVAVVGWAAEKRTFDLCRALGASLVVANEEISP